MASYFNLIQQVVQEELKQINLMEQGVVTAVFPHATESDKDNYQCSVRLKNRKQADGSDFELRKVPIACAHIGLVNIPEVGDQVLVGFVRGDVNSPLILNRIYNDEKRPPLSKKKEIVLRHHKDTTTKLTIDAEGALIIQQSDDTKISIAQDGNIDIIANGEININNGEKGAARKDDEIEVTVKGFFIIEGGLPVKKDKKLKGTIKSSSQTVLIGD